MHSMVVKVSKRNIYFQMISDASTALCCQHPFLSEMTAQESSEKVQRDRKRVHSNDWYTVSSDKQDRGNFNDGYT
jgi:hypothetical protein